MTVSLLEIFPLQMQVTTDVYVGGSMQILQNILYTEIIDFETLFSTAAMLAPLVARFGSSISTSSYYLTEKKFRGHCYIKIMYILCVLHLPY